VRALAIGTVSLAIHAMVLAAVEAPDPERPRADASPPAPAIDVVEYTPVDVVLVPSVQPADAHVAATAPTEGKRAPGPDAPLTGGAARTPSGAPTGPTGPAPEGATAGGALAMRHAPSGDGGRLAARAAPGLDLSLGAASAVLAEILSRPPPPEVPTSGRLEANRDGTHTGRDLVFTATIEPDGHVASIEDRPNFNYKVHVPRPKRMARAAGNHLERWAKDPYGVATGTGEDVAKNGDDDVRDGRVFTIVSGGFDATDAVMRWAGQDPYDARKRAFLEDTFDERVELGRAHRKTELARSDQHILRNLDRLWTRDDLGASERRALIFELWEECAETGSAQQIEGGERARAALYRFVRTKLPDGSADAFTAAELAALNRRRRSKATFAPYD
jgi:hypothetical protein